MIRVFLLDDLDLLPVPVLHLDPVFALGVILKADGVQLAVSPVAHNQFRRGELEDPDPLDFVPHEIPIQIPPVGEAENPFSLLLASQFAQHEKQLFHTQSSRTAARSLALALFFFLGAASPRFSPET